MKPIIKSHIAFIILMLLKYASNASAKRADKLKTVAERFSYAYRPNASISEWEPYRGPASYQERYAYNLIEGDSDICDIYSVRFFDCFYRVVNRGVKPGQLAQRQSRTVSFLDVSSSKQALQAFMAAIQSYGYRPLAPFDAMQVEVTIEPPKCFYTYKDRVIVKWFPPATEAELSTVLNEIIRY